jgi:hypothetical protein
MENHEYLQKTVLALLIEVGLDLPTCLRKTLSDVTVCLLENTKAHVARLGECLAADGKANAMGGMQRVRRLLSDERIAPSKTVLPLINLMRPLLESHSEIILAIDRTDWAKRGKYINILSVAFVYSGRAIPLFWIVLDRKGNSSLEHWKQVLAPAIEGLQQMEWLSDKPIHVVADREFSSPKLAEWLKNTYNVEATLRMKSSIYLKHDEEPEVKISTLLGGMKKGDCHILHDQFITRDSNFRMDVMLEWEEKYKEAMVVATTILESQRASKLYGLRFCIEPMHKDLKSNAFEIQKTRVTDPKRIETLIIPMAFAYVLCVLEGEKKKTQATL